MALLKTLALLVVASLFVSGVKSLECYACTSGCGDPFKSSSATKIPCSGSCMKGVEKSGEKRTLRGCSPEKKETKCDETTIQGITGTICYCDGNLCNGGTRNAFAMTSPLMLYAVVVLIKHIMAY